MPATSKQQQKFFGLALSVKRGDTPRSEVSDDVLKVVDTMSEKEIEKYAGTEHTGLPTKKEEVEDIIRQEVRNWVRPLLGEGRAFINAARKAKEEGKTEFEFNGKTYPVTLKEEVLNEMNDLEYVGDQLVNGVGEGFMSRNEFVKLVGKETKYDKNTLGKIYDTYLKLDGRNRVKLDMTRNMKKFLNKMGLKESVNENYKSIMSDGGRNLFFAIVDDKTDRVETIDLKKWLKASPKDKSSDDSKKRVVNAILRNQKQFNKKVDYNMWEKKNKPSFEEKMDYFMKNGFINNITKRGIKVYEGVESVNEGKVELEFDLFKNYNQRRPDKKMLVKVDDSVRLSKYLASPEFNRIKKQYDYVEVHYGDKFLGSMMAGTDNWEFKKGSGLSGSGFKESVSEGRISKTFKFPKTITTSKFDEIDADLSRMGIKSEPDFNTNTIRVSGDERKIMKIVNKYKGIEESVNEEIKDWGTIQNVFVKFLQANTKILDKKVKSKDEEGTKKIIKGIIAGLTNAQRSLKLESVDEVMRLKMSTSQMKQLHKAYDKLSYDDMRRIMLSVVKRDKFLKSLKRFDKSSLQQLVDMKPNSPFSKAVQAYVDGKIKESVSEMKYSNQTGIKSSVLRDNEFSNLLSPKEQKWARGNDVKIYKDRFGFIFTDGKREMVFNLKKPYSVVKPMGNARSEIKKVYQQNESVVSEKKVPKKGSADYHQHKIAVDTVKNPNKSLMGGPSAKEAEEILMKKFGYSKSEISKLQN